MIETAVASTGRNGVGVTVAPAGLPEGRVCCATVVAVLAICSGTWQARPSSRTGPNKGNYQSTNYQSTNFTNYRLKPPVEGYR
ncbi:MAG: hypothetical protein ACE5GO_01125 [Anaerolineales bacterium]